MMRFLFGFEMAMMVALASGCTTGGGGGGGSGGDGGDGGTSGTGGQAGGPLCGYRACNDQEYCQGDPSECGNGGDCMPRPVSCEPSDHPVCTCEGIIYPNECEAFKAGASLGEASMYKCAETPSNRYRCNASFCLIGEEWCRQQAESSWTCEPLPEACKVQDATCECLGFDQSGLATADSPTSCDSCQSGEGQFGVQCSSF